MSDDAEMVSLVREIAGRLPAECECICGEAIGAGAADVCVWDLDGRLQPPSDGGRRTRDLFLVRRRRLKAFLEQKPEARGNTLLKPVSPAALEVFLSHAVAEAGGPSRESHVQDAMPESDRDGLLECLLHASLRLQEFEEDRTHFWARAAHDLRAPLTAANGYCGMLIEEQFGPLTEGQREIVLRVRRSLERLSRMASAMFQLTAGRQLDRKYELKRTDIRECIQRSVEQVRCFSAEKNLSLDLDVTAPARPLYAEPSQLEQVLVNLLENACKFTPRNGSIRVRGYPVSWPPATGPGGPATAAKSGLQDAPGAYRVDVSDSGPGIPPEYLPTIFEEYVSYGDQQDRSGGGLGLAICKMIVRAHNGEIWAEVGGPGTTFSFVLPCNRPVIAEGFEQAVLAG